jgi:hypothetical protein
MSAVLAELEKEGISKQEKVTFFKSKINALEGQIYLTPTRLVVMSVSANKVRLGGLVGAFIELTKKKTYPVLQLNIELDKIKDLNKGKFGLNRNILEITNQEDEVIKVGVKNYEEWESLLKAKVVSA